MPIRELNSKSPRHSELVASDVGHAGSDVFGFFRTVPEIRSEPKALLPMSRAQGETEARPLALHPSTTTVEHRHHSEPISVQ